MTQPTLLQVLALYLILASTNYRYLAACAQPQSSIPPFSVAGSNGVCPSEPIRDDLKSAIQQEIRTQLQNYTQNQEQIEDQDDGSYCDGTSGWTRIVHLNMTNMSHTCPANWYERYLSGLRLCGRESGNPVAGSCSPVAAFSTGGVPYSQVCGQARGYQYADVLGFAPSSFNPQIDSYYADGLSLTHGTDGLRVHIWTFVNGRSDVGGGPDACPCNTNSSGTAPPSIVGSKYFCESGVYDGSNMGAVLFLDDPLWDGAGCAPEANTCCEFNSPPYFSTRLPSATTDDIEGRICNGAPDEFGGTFITFLELFIK